MILCPSQLFCDSINWQLMYERQHEPLWQSLSHNYGMEWIDFFRLRINI